MDVMIVLESWGIGGTEQYVRRLYQALKLREPGWKLHVVLMDDRIKDSLSDLEGWCDQCTRLGSRGVTRWNRLRALIRRECPDICHLHLYTSMLPAALAVVLAHTEAKLFLTFHSPISQWSLRHRCGFRIATMFAQTVIGASEFTAAQLRKWRTDVITASPSIEIDSLKPASETSAESQLPHAHFRIVGCGRLSREKDWGTLIKAVSGCTDLERTVTCELIGNGPDRTELEALISRLGCQDRIRLCGAVPHGEVVDRVGTANLFVLPSRFEGFGMVAVEAMSLGIPTITSGFPASSEYIKPAETGHTFPIGDSDALAELIRWHVAHPREAKEVGRRGRDSVLTRFVPARSASLHRKLYVTAKAGVNAASNNLIADHSQ